ncbi:helix-turn-helix domain-containing protein [Bradyrhizobium sp. 76]|uniref:helix-turn-helix domain-containing protein n=1 Tax=Bradyrhizobium sp. 76 TaxID=2782680 RepID=UPI001FF8156B|nr:helix-turn-helix domain-containing protein [Bradyrhizobium sp. 76]MCK1410195.1 hypothetical protein [Bradyrhizobium sp. 76]
MSHDENEGNLDPTPIITSPTGRRIKITQGAKLAFDAAVQGAPQYELSGFQKRLYSRLVDRTNEGRKASPEKHGYAFPSAVTLAKELGCSVSAVKENLTALELGVMAGRKRADGSKAADKIIPEHWRIMVKRKVERGRGGAGNSNLYWLPMWDIFGAVDEDGKTVRGKTVRGATETVCGETETVRGASTNGLRRGPDSPYLPTSPTHLKDAHSKFAPLIGAPASGERWLVDFNGEWANHPQGFLAWDWTWIDRDFQPAIDLLGLDEYELDAEIDRFVEHHPGERRHDWHPGWLEWIQALKASQSSDGQPEPATAGDYGPERCDEDPPF